MFLSKLDSLKNISESEWALTLIRQRSLHTEIILEGAEKINETIQPFIYLIHLRAKSDTSSGCCTASCYEGAIPEILNLTKQNEIKRDNQTPTWMISKEKGGNLISMVEEEKERVLTVKESIRFAITGKYSFSQFLRNMLGSTTGVNCLTWAVEKLYFTGIKILFIETPWYKQLITYANNSKNYAKLTVPYKTESQYNLTDFCRFVKNGNSSLITSFFPPHLFTGESPPFDINTVTSHQTILGPVETYLRDYNPLMIAAAYRLHNIVKLLIEEYHAKLTPLGGRKKDFTVLDCAEKKWWFVFFVDKQMVKYLKDQGAKNYVKN